ncbi:MAG: ATP-binding protein, partial [Microcoleus sp.]
ISTNSTSTSSSHSSLLDLTTVLKASQALASEIVLDRLLEKLMKIAIENAGAQKGFLLMPVDGKLLIQAAASVESSDITVEQCPTVAPGSVLPITVINYVERTHSDVVLSEATREGLFTQDSYIKRQQVRSALCTPILNQSKLVGILYLENNLTSEAFSTTRLEVLKMLSSQAAISLENAVLVANLSAAKEQLEDYSRTLEVRVEERTQELKTSEAQLREKATQLEVTLSELRSTQTQLIQTEKMSSLGQLVAGVAHEINNPINFIYGNVIHASDYSSDLLGLIDLYQQSYPNPTPEIVAKTEDIDICFIQEDLPKLLQSMRVGVERVRNIVLSLRNFSRLDEADMKPVDVHSGIESTLLILQHRLKNNADGSGIQVIKDYGELPKVNCYASGLNQVFMNVLSNAIYAVELGVGLHEKAAKLENPLSQIFEPKIQIRTEVCDKNFVRICIADNGPGMTEEVRSRIFDPFFTTKAVGQGTGLGLSISYQIVVEKHGGKLMCVSAPGEGAEFIIEIPVKQ